jgi:predicted nucleic-acid-binding Zn-ribbon protein
MSQNIKFYRLYCEVCTYNRITNGEDISDLVEYKRSPLMTELPKFNETTKQVEKKPPKKLAKMFKCPKCGRLIKPRRIPDTNELLDKFSKKPNENFNPRSETSPEEY